MKRSRILPPLAFPASFRMIPLKTTVVTPDEISPTKADTPSWHEDNSFLSEGSAHRNLTVLRVRILNLKSESASVAELVHGKIGKPHCIFFLNQITKFLYHLHLIIWNMTRKLKITENEKYTL